jgi:hypothetical protein
MNVISEFLTRTPVVTLVLGFVVFLLAGFFIVYFLVPALFLIARLKKIASSLQGLKNPQPRALEQAFSKDPALSHLLGEYLRTLHKIQDGGVGDPQSGDWRSTTPASSIFITEAIVDARLQTEFFKHLPGIFTGIGIIGTFSCLIRGLQAFQVSADAAVVRGGLEGLMHRVSDAFYVSAPAICLAMLATFV